MPNIQAPLEIPADRTALLRGFAGFAWAVLGYNLAVILWGAYVRATGSGAGCGNHWPLCNGEVAPHSPAMATIIEFTHRATSGIDLALVAVLVFWAFRAFPRGHAVRRGAVLSSVFLLSEALIGAMLVLMEHVAQNASASRAWSLSAHLLNTLTLVACLSLTAWWASGHPAARPSWRRAWPAAAVLGAVAVLGVSGAIAALGDTLFPARSFAEGFARDFDPAANPFVRLRIWHPPLAAGVALLLLCYVLAGPRRWLGNAVLALLAVQLAAGALNLALLAPVWMQLVHLLLADLLWIALVLLAAERLRRPEQPNM
jgi:heme A synthase